MKRVIICSVLLVFAVAASLYSSHKVVGVDTGMEERIDAISVQIQSENIDELVTGVSQLGTYWEKQEDYLVHFLRHSHIDTISGSVSRLPSLAAYGNFAEVGAELAIIRRQMEHIRSSEILTLKNIF